MSVRQDIEREQERQTRLLAALWRQAEPGELDVWLQALSPCHELQRGIRVYQANAGAAIERALAANFPTVQALMGEASFAALARAYWHAHPPMQGDLALAGAALPEFIATSELLAAEPYLADVARLDAAIDAAERATDGQWQPESLHLLGEYEPQHLWLDVLPGTAVLCSPYPLSSIRAAHDHSEDNDAAWAVVRARMAAGVGENVLIWRGGYRAQSMAIDNATAEWMKNLLRGVSLGQALSECDASFVFEPWLKDCLTHGWLARVRVG